MTDSKLSGFNPLETLDLTDAFRKPPYCEPGNPIEGWDVFDRGEGVLEIERVDESTRFTSDKEAAAYVVAAAKDTSTPEARALLHLFSVCLAPIIEQAQEATEGHPFTVVLNAQQAEMIKRLRYW